MTILVTVFFTLINITYGQAEKPINKRYVPTCLRSNMDIAKVKENIAITLKRAEVYNIKDRTNGSAKDVLVLDDRIEFFMIQPIKDKRNEDKIYEWEAKAGK